MAGAGLAPTAAGSEPAAAEAEDAEARVAGAAAWVRAHGGWNRVAVQVPDARLAEAPALCAALVALVARGPGGRRVRAFVLADSAYSPCCVDEVAAQHLGADCVVHVGEACLSPVTALPAFCVFDRAPLDAAAAACAAAGPLRAAAPDGCPVVVLFELRFAHAAGALGAALRAALGPAFAVAVAEPRPHVLVPAAGEAAAAAGPCCGGGDPECAEGPAPAPAGPPAAPPRPPSVPSTGALTWEAPVGAGRGEEGGQQGQQEDATRFLWVGREGPAALMHMMTRNRQPWYVLDPADGRCAEQATNRALMRRYYLVQRARESAILGILVGTLGVKGHVEAINGLQRLIEAAGKKAYTFVIGKVNQYKLANFPEIDAFILVSCPQTALLDSRDFLAPILTPHEARLALDESLGWPGDYDLDFRRLALGRPAGEGDAGTEGSGNRALVEAEGAPAAAALVTVGPKAVQAQAPDAASFLRQRAYQGLQVPATGAEAKQPELAKPGWSGRAAGYAGEDGERYRGGEGG